MEEPNTIRYYTPWSSSFLLGWGDYIQFSYIAQSIGLYSSLWRNKRRPKKSRQDNLCRLPWRNASIFRNRARMDSDYSPMNMNRNLQTSQRTSSNRRDNYLVDIKFHIIDRTQSLELSVVV